MVTTFRQAILGIMLMVLLEHTGLCEPKSQETGSNETLPSPEEGLRLLETNARKQRTLWNHKNKTTEQDVLSAYREPFPGGKYIVNGDTPLLNKKQLIEFFQTQIKAESPSLSKEPLKLQQGPRELAVNTVAGHDTIWNNIDKRQLTYCVSNAFGPRHDQVVKAMEQAGKAWSEVADLEFIHLMGQDSQCDMQNQSVLFDVRPVNVKGKYLARAFFPNEPRQARNVLIEESAFHFDLKGQLQLVGILRHELGHILGFRHEHTRPEATKCFEDANWRGVTSYDGYSVMHYPQCNGKGNWTLQLTENDKNGVACIYGARKGFLIDPRICSSNSIPSAVQVNNMINESIDSGAEKQYAAVDAKAGTIFKVNMQGNGPGDADLYVRFGPDVTKTEFDCRPFLEDSNESCSLDVPGDPTGATAHIMVVGYKSSQYNLTITYTPK